MRECVSICLDARRDDLYEMLRTIKEGERVEVSYRFADEDWDGVDFNTRHEGICRCSDGLIREISSDVVTVIVERDDSNRFGFRLVTAFPDIRLRAATFGDLRFTGRSLVPALTEVIESRFHERGKAVRNGWFVAYSKQLANGVLDESDKPNNDDVKSKSDGMLARAKAEFAPKSVPVKQASPPGGEARRKYHESA